MFMQGAPEALDRKFFRLQCRDLVVRNVMALSAGVQKTAFWDLSHDTSARDDVMTLMFGKLKLEEFAGGAARSRYPMADAFRRMAGALGDVESVHRIDVPDRPSIFLFEARRRGRGPVYVVWERRDAFSGEDAPPTPFDWPWAAPGARAVDALGQTVPAEVVVGRLSLPLSVTPVFVEE
jgi:hypothetical protein